MTEDSNYSKFVYQPNQLEVKISQCKECTYHKGNESCRWYKQIPLPILVNKETCSSRNEECT